MWTNNKSTDWIQWCIFFAFFTWNYDKEKMNKFLVEVKKNFKGTWKHLVSSYSISCNKVILKQYNENDNSKQIISWAVTGTIKRSSNEKLKQYLGSTSIWFWPWLRIASLFFLNARQSITFYLITLMLNNSSA